MHLPNTSISVPILEARNESSIKFKGAAKVSIVEISHTSMQSFKNQN